MTDLPHPKHYSVKDKGERPVELHRGREQRRTKAEREAKEEGERRAREEARKLDRAEPDFGDGQSVGSQRTVKAGDGGGCRRPQSVGDSRKPPCRGATDE